MSFMSWPLTTVHWAKNLSHEVGLVIFLFTAVFSGTQRTDPLETEANSNLYGTVQVQLFKTSKNCYQFFGSNLYSKNEKRVPTVAHYIGCVCCLSSFMPDQWKGSFFCTLKYDNLKIKDWRLRFETYYCFPSLILFDFGELRLMCCRITQSAAVLLMNNYGRILCWHELVSCSLFYRSTPAVLLASLLSKRLLTARFVFYSLQIKSRFQIIIHSTKKTKLVIKN